MTDENLARDFFYSEKFIQLHKLYWIKFFFDSKICVRKEESKYKKKEC